LHLPSTHPKPTGQTLLIWGGSTSVGCNAIQLAVSAGYEVFTTCSPKNVAYMKRLGASRVFDYNSQTVKQDLIKAFEGKPCAGALAVTIGSTDLCMDIVHACKAPGSRKFVAVASAPAPLPSPPSALKMVSMISSFAVAGTKTFVKAKRCGIGYKMIFGTTLAFNDVGKAIYEDYLPKALERGTFVCAPEPLVVEGVGLEYVQEGMEVQKKGVSARKVVVRLI
jgi:Zinc-binding dehydrogenase